MVDREFIFVQHDDGQVWQALPADAIEAVMHPIKARNPIMLSQASLNKRRFFWLESSNIFQVDYAIEIAERSGGDFVILRQPERAACPECFLGDVRNNFNSKFRLNDRPDLGGFHAEIGRASCRERV